MPETILLAEDEVSVAMYEARMLKRSGFEVILADSGEKAIAKVKSVRDVIPGIETADFVR